MIYLRACEQYLCAVDVLLPEFDAIPESADSLCLQKIGLGLHL